MKEDHVIKTLPQTLKEMNAKTRIYPWTVLTGGADRYRLSQTRTFSVALRHYNLMREKKINRKANVLG